MRNIDSPHFFLSVLIVDGMWCLSPSGSEADEVITVNCRREGLHPRGSPSPCVLMNIKRLDKLYSDCLLYFMLV